jgi:nucleoside-diphosphate-sugar epimerase
MAERVLLAGCGDLGLRVAALLRARGEEVFALRRQPGDSAEVQWVQADLTRPETLSKIPEGMTQLVYTPTPGARDEAAYRAIFIEGLQNVLQALDTASLRRVLLVSSSAVYGEHGDAWVDEDTPPSPPGFNGRVLLEAEQWLAHQPVRSIALRLAGLYGPGRLQLIERLREGQAKAPRDGVHWANRMHIDDAAAAMAHLLVLPDPQSLYVGVDDTPLPLHELYAYLAELTGAPEVGDGPAPAGVGSKRLSNARLRASGLVLRWPDTREGYVQLLRAS